jgi:hypothetical protein
LRRLWPDTRLKKLLERLRRLEKHSRAAARDSGAVVKN